MLEYFGILASALVGITVLTTWIGLLPPISIIIILGLMVSIVISYCYEIKRVTRKQLLILIISLFAILGLPLSGLAISVIIVGFFLPQKQLDYVPSLDDDYLLKASLMALSYDLYHINYYLGLIALTIIGSWLLRNIFRIYKSYKKYLDPATAFSIFGYIGSYAIFITSSLLKGLL